MVGRFRSFEPIYPYYHYQGPYSGGRGSGKRELAKIEVALSKLGGYQVKLLGEQLRKGWCLAASTSALPSWFPAFPSFRASEFQASEFQSKDQMLQWIKIEDRRIEEVLGARVLSRLREGKKAEAGEDGKGAAGGKGTGAGRELACLAKGRINWRLTWCL